MLILPLLLALSISAYLMARLLYLRYVRACWEETCALYVIRMGESQDNLARYTTMWPMWQMLSYAHVWSHVERFVVNQEGMTKVLAYFLAREQEVRAHE